MSKIFGYFVSNNDDGGVTTTKVKSYETYDEMVADRNPEYYGIVKQNNTVYHRDNGSWVTGFPNVGKEVEDYTAFEVFAHDYTIPVGECEELGGYVTNEIAPCMGHHMVILTNATDATKADGTIDWGDGTVESMSSISSDRIVGDKWHFTHEYTQPGKYIVKVYGKDVASIRTGPMYAPSLPSSIDGTKFLSLICRVFDKDLPVSKRISNWSGFAGHSKRLIHVDMSSSPFVKYAMHADNVFYNCRNLLSVTGYVEYFSNTRRMSQPIAYCLSLKNTDIKLPSNPYALSSFADNCRALEIDIMDLIPRTFVVPNNTQASISNLFNNCLKLGLGKITLASEDNQTFVINQDFYNAHKADETIKTQMDNILEQTAEKLGRFFWNNQDAAWKSTSSAFKGCSDLIRSYIPTSWGGTKAA